MADVRLYHTADGGDIDFSDDGTYAEVLLDTGLETAAYLSLFGGNERDDGTEHDDNNPDHAHQAQWWGNLGEPKSRQMRSKTANLLRGLPAVSTNLVRLEQAAEEDLAWLLEENVAQEVAATVTLTNVNRVNFAVRIVSNNQEYIMSFYAEWGN